MEFELEFLYFSEIHYSYYWCRECARARTAPGPLRDKTTERSAEGSLCQNQKSTVALHQACMPLA